MKRFEFMKFYKKYLIANMMKIVMPISVTSAAGVYFSAYFSKNNIGKTSRTAADIIAKK